MPIKRKVEWFCDREIALGLDAQRGLFVVPIPSGRRHAIADGRGYLCLIGNQISEYCEEGGGLSLLLVLAIHQPTETLR